jgi:S-(hydroxymethyl)glutathione dehydrogenase/alcohol dehydrogenase
VRAERLEQAQALGATHVVDASRQDPVVAIRAITRRGADYSFAAVGDVRAMGQAIDCLAPAGTAVIIGVPATGATVPLTIQPLVAQERVVRGSIYGSARTREDFPRLVELYMAGKLRLDDLITRRYSIDEANEGFRDLAAGALARGLIVF